MTETAPLTPRDAAAILGLEDHLPERDGEAEAWKALHGALASMPDRQRFETIEICPHTAGGVIGAAVGFECDLSEPASAGLHRVLSEMRRLWPPVSDEEFSYQLRRNGVPLD